MNAVRNVILASALLTTGFTSAFAAYTITRTDGGNNTLLVQGREYEYRITNTNSPRRLEDITIDLSNPGFDILVPPGVQTGPNKYSVDANGELNINIRFHNAATYSMTVRNSQDPNNNGTLNSIQVQRYPVTFSISPNNPVVNSNVPFDINVTALDAQGVTVTAFEDPVQIVDSQLGEITFIPGTSFTNGQAQNVSITVKAAGLDNKFTLTLTMVGQQYFDPTLPNPSLAPRATKVTNPALTLIPGAFNKLVMLFPGETLTPGSGKSGAVDPQQSGVPVSAVSVRRVDAFFNPILVNPSPAINVQFTSSQGATDAPPFPFTLSMTGPLLSITADMNQIFFGGSGDRIVKATPDGITSQEDSSIVPVNPGAAESYVITLNNVAPNQSIDTDYIISGNIQALDQNGQPLNTLFGPVSGAELRAQFGGNQESALWVDTNQTTLIPNNVIAFNAGVANFNLVVTKFGSDARIRYITPSSPASESIPFTVDVGAANKIHFTFIGKAPNPTQGQVWTPGTFPGNSGTPPVIKAGEEYVVEARITDKRWNLISGGGSAFTLQLVNNLPNHFIESRNIHPSLPGPIYSFPNNGEFAFTNDPAFDRSFRVKFRTAGSAVQFRGNSNLVGSPFFSSTCTVTPEAYSKLVIVAPGETLRPGIDSEVDGKEGAPTQRQAGVSFTATVNATDLYFNPIINGPFPSVNFAITPNSPTSFVSGTLPAQMVSGTRNFSVTLSSGSDVRVFDAAAGAIQQTVSIPVANGPLHHFRMNIATLGSKEAGVPFQVTVLAQDQFDNTVTNFNSNVSLTPTTGAGTLTPASVALANGSFTGDLTLFAASPTVNIQLVNGSVSSMSPNITVLTNSLGYARLLLLLAGETLAPGTALGKTGTPSPITTGLVSIARVIACDAYYNPINTTGLVGLASSGYVQFGAAQGSLVNVDGRGEFSTTLILRQAAAHSITVRDVNMDGVISRSTSAITGLAGTYRKIQIIAPGEAPDPGTFVASGKTTAGPVDQDVATPFDVQLRAVDDFWNLVSFNGGDLRLSADKTAVSFLPPNNNGGNNPRAFLNGLSTRQIIIGDQGLVNISVIDDLNLTKPGQSVGINARPGATYRFQTASTATAGQAFPAVTITLEDSNGVIAGYNESIFLSADLTSGGTGSGSFNPDGSVREYVMTNGSVTVTDLTYAFVESIKIRLSDNFGRLAFSDPINVVPSGLKYRVNVPASAVAGPPATFQVIVELLEENTNTLVKNHDHAVDVAVVSAINPTTDGQFSVTSANLSQGVANFDQTYTKAESILIQIRESATAGDPGFAVPDKNSNNINISADGYKKLLLTVPGETHTPGVPSATGKTGVPFNRQKGVAFLAQVRGVDQYWNVANAFSGGQIAWNSSDVPASLGANNPSNQNAPLVSGESATFIVLNTAGNVTITVRDASNPNIGTQSATLIVGGLFYQIDSVPAQTFAGPPNQFTMNVTLFDSSTNLPVTSANNAIAVEARRPDGNLAGGTLGVTSGQLVNGTVGLTNQSYSIAEDVLIRVTDADGNNGVSSVIQFIPRQVTYLFTTPTEATVNTPFDVQIQAFDKDTGTPVSNLTRTNTLEAFSSLTGLAVAGTFSPNTVNIVNGLGTVSAVYNLAEPIFLRMTDTTPPASLSPPTQPVFASQGSIIVRPGALATISGINDFTMLSNETRTFHLVLTDSFGNTIPAQNLRLRVNSLSEPGQMFMNGVNGDVTVIANGQGELDITFNPTADVNGLVEIVMSDADRPSGYSRLLNITVQGLTRTPARALGLGENRIPINALLPLDIRTIASAGGIVRTFYRLDGGAWQTYDPAVGAQGFSQTKRYTVEWYSEVCYDVNCTNPVSELAINGSPNFIELETYVINQSVRSFPNPFNPKGGADESFSTIQYPLDSARTVKIRIYDIFGQQVWQRDISAGDQGAQAREDNQVFWFGDNDDGIVVANGIYIATVDTGNQLMKTKIAVVK